MLSCHFSLAPEDLGALGIEWSIRPKDISYEGPVIIWFTANHIYDHFEHCGRRVQFEQLNPAIGNVSIRISNLEVTDTNTYMCQIRKLHGIKACIVQLNVTKRPTKAECHVQGAVKLDNQVVLRCHAKGSPPMWYTGSMGVPGKRVPFGSIVDPASGGLVLKIPQEVAQGTAQNRVGITQCLVVLRFQDPPENCDSGVTVLIAIIIVSSCCKRRRQVENPGKEIQEDAPPHHKWLPRKSCHSLPSTKEVKTTVQVMQRVPVY